DADGRVRRRTPHLHRLRAGAGGRGGAGPVRHRPGRTGPVRELQAVWRPLHRGPAVRSRRTADRGAPAADRADPASRGGAAMTDVQPPGAGQSAAASKSPAPDLDGRAPRPPVVRLRASMVKLVV